MRVTIGMRHGRGACHCEAEAFNVERDVTNDGAVTDVTLVKAVVLGQRYNLIRFRDVLWAATEPVR